MPLVVREDHSPGLFNRAHQRSRLDTERLDQGGRPIRTGKVMTQHILRRAMDRACVLFSDLIEGRWEKVDGEFDATLRGHVLTDASFPCGRRWWIPPAASSA